MPTAKCTPIETLPDDVLQLVLQTASDGANLLGPEFWRTRLGLAVSTSQVSHRWRALALNSPILWATITHEWGTRCQLDRSQVAPLTVVWKNESMYGEENSAPISILESLTSQAAERLRYLDLQLSKAEFNVILLHLRVKMPFLQTLAFKLHPTQQSDEDIGPSGFSRPLMIDAVFLTYTPFLHSLTLTDVDLPWPEAVSSWPALTHLELSGWSEDKLRPEVFFRMLQELPHLEFLRIAVGRIDESRLPFTQEASDISLQALRTLDITFVDLESTVDFSRRLVVTGQCYISFMVIYASTFSHTEPHLLLAEVLPRSPRRSVRTLRFSQSGENSYAPHTNVQLEGELYDFDSPSSADGDAALCPFKLEISFIPFGETETVTRATFALYDFTQVHTIDVCELSVSHDRDFWHYLSQMCASAKTVKLQHHVVGAFVGASLRGIEQDPPLFLFHNCRHLELPHLSNSSFGGNTKTDLQNILRARKERGFGLQTLKAGAEDEQARDEWTGYAEEIDMWIFNPMAL